MPYFLFLPSDQQSALQIFKKTGKAKAAAQGDLCSLSLPQHTPGDKAAQQYLNDGARPEGIKAVFQRLAPSVQVRQP